MHIEDFNKCMEIDDWYMHYVRNIFENIMHKMWKLEMKLKKNTFGHSQKRESEEDFNACMNIDGWIHTLCYEIYLKNIMHKMWKLEMKLKKKHIWSFSKERERRRL